MQPDEEELEEIFNRKLIESQLIHGMFVMDLREGGVIKL
jgi:hypothetical protein